MFLLDLVLAMVIVGLIAWVVNVYVPTGDTRTILNVVLALLVVGMGLWLVNTYVPMAGSIKAILNVVVVVATCVRVLQTLGLWPRVVSLWDRLTHSRQTAKTSDSGLAELAAKPGARES